VLQAALRTKAVMDGYEALALRIARQRRYSPKANGKETGQDSSNSARLNFPGDGHERQVQKCLCYFIESKRLSHSVGMVQRINLLECLQGKGPPTNRAFGQTQSFENILLDPERIRDFEAALAAYAETDDGEPYVRGDLFCFEDHVLFLIFDRGKGESQHSHRHRLRLSNA